MRGSLFFRYAIVNGFMYDESDNSNIPSSIICTFCFLKSALAKNGTDLEWPIIGVVSVYVHFIFSRSGGQEISVISHILLPYLLFNLDIVFFIAGIKFCDIFHIIF
jgi:hypothetical protein